MVRHNDHRSRKPPGRLFDVVQPHGFRSSKEKNALCAKIHSQLDLKSSGRREKRRKIKKVILLLSSRGRLCSSKNRVSYALLCSIRVTVLRESRAKPTRENQGKKGGILVRLADPASHTSWRVLNAWAESKTSKSKSTNQVHLLIIRSRPGRGSMGMSPACHQSPSSLPRVRSPSRW